MYKNSKRAFRSKSRIYAVSVIGGRRTEEIYRFPNRYNRSQDEVIKTYLYDYKILEIKEN